MPLITLKAQIYADLQTEAVLKDAMFCATKVYNGLLGHLGIMVCDDVDERNTSITCHACGKIRASNRRQRSLYTCSCGWRAQADMNGALNIFKRAYQVSPVKGSSGRVARPAAVSFLLGWHGVVEPKCEGKPLRASAWGCPLIY